MLVNSDQLQIILFQKRLYLGDILRINTELGQLSGSNHLFVMACAYAGVEPDGNRMSGSQLSKLLQLT